MQLTVTHKAFASPAIVVSNVKHVIIDPAVKGDAQARLLYHEWLENFNAGYLTRKVPDPCTPIDTCAK